MRTYYLGVDIGGTKCAAVLGMPEDGQAHVLDRICMPTQPQSGLQSTLDRLYETIDALLQRNHLQPGRLRAIGVSCGGPLDSAAGRILSPPNLYGWDDVPITALLTQRYGVPAWLQNDANACVLAEWKFGAARGCRNAVFLTFGTGMGAGLILDKRLYLGTNGMSGEVGHIRLSEHGPVGYGNDGSFEGFCSGGGIPQLARTMVLELLQQGKPCAYCRSLAELDGITAKAVADAALAGDETAMAVYRRCAVYLGRGLSVLIDILNPEVIVIGSIFERSEQLLRQPMLETIGKEALASSAACCRIVPASFGDRLGDIAALSVAMSEEEECV